MVETDYEGFLVDWQDAVGVMNTAGMRGDLVAARVTRMSVCKLHSCRQFVDIGGINEDVKK